MGNEPDVTGMVDQARKVEEWARKEIYAQGLEDSPEVFDYLVKGWMHKQGISQYTNKQVLLNKLYTALSQPPKSPDNRAKIREITRQMSAQHDVDTERLRKSHLSQQAKLKEQLSEAYKFIRENVL